MTSQTKNPSPDATRAEVVESIKKAITSTVAPATWKDNGGTVGSIMEDQGQLIVTQTKKNQAQVESVLDQLRRGADLQIGIETRMMFVDEALYASLGFTPHADGGTDSTLLPGDTELRSLLQQTHADAKTIAISSPRLTLFNGQMGFIKIGQEVAKQTPGIRLNLKAAASADRRSVILHLGSSLTQPGMDEQRASTNVTVPTGCTLVMGGLIVKSDDDTDKSSCRRMIILVRPKIINEKDVEKALYGLTDHHPVNNKKKQLYSSSQTPFPQPLQKLTATPRPKPFALSSRGVRAPIARCGWGRMRSR